MKDTNDKRIKELEDEIADLKSRMPAHSVKPIMIIRLEELEDELRRLKKINEKEDEIC